ncbi:helix-turn-helix domain-containing protein [Pseudomonas sp. PDM15]|uniref:AraC family transcriptional regulator n=1 Tax=Pseudomonas sp. PDM15 TaxID=2769303 RepID=UPI0017874884|nr:helix-turn-helix domain-containing protein [Pseudomonas sp. PDM15]MBD9427795.1 helix-turn-helix domain-containing protein [Pseudomonas sp. PDM15]
MAINHLAIGRACFVVRAGSLPNGYNQRPGMTLLLADGEPLELEIDGQSVVSADAWLLAPEIRRRFVRPQPHVSITVEPSHPAYARLLRWARLSPNAAHRLEVTTADRARLAEAATQQTFDAWLDGLLAHNQQPSAAANPRLEHLLALVQEADIETSAEQIWQSFRLRYPSTQAHCSHWLQECIGIPLRKLLLWQKLRRALEALSGAHGATEVAHAAGFADSAHLSRICLRTFGLRPSQANDHKILQVNRFPDY